MLENKDVLIREFVTALRNHNASVFMGAGMSYKVFGLKWKDLIAPYATKVGVNLKSCSNYPFVAQAYANVFSKENLKDEISKKFISDEISSIHSIFARLPISEYWTTNYDKLIENALKSQRKHFDTIYNNDSFISIDDTRERVVYKCHGDCLFPESIVITQDDYEEYNFKNFNFANAFLKALATNTFLFLGYSFNDPDLNNLLAKIRVVNKKRTCHFLITKKEKVVAKQKAQLLWVENIERYGIKTLLIDNYSNIEEIVEEIEKQYMSYKILISGSAEVYYLLIAGNTELKGSKRTRRRR